MLLAINSLMCNSIAEMEINMKKRLKWIVTGIISLVLFIPLIYLLIFISKTMNSAGTHKYSADNTEIHAVSFEAARYRPFGEEVEYQFRVASDAMSTRSELFIFQGVQFGPFRKSREWGRFRFAYHALTNEEELVGSVLFTPRDYRGQKQTTNCMVFYSSNPSNQISRCIFTVEENGELCTVENISLTKKAFVAILPDLGEKDGVLRKFVKAEFFDLDGNLVETME